MVPFQMRTVIGAGCPVWVKRRKAQTEHNTSAVLPLATLERTCRDVGFVPEVAKLAAAGCFGIRKL